LLKIKLVSIALALFSLSALGDASVPMWSYTVKSGDNLINIAKLHLANASDWKQVQSLNRIKNPYRIPVGTELLVPLTLVKHQPAPAEIVSVSGIANLQKNEVNTPLSLGQKLAVGAKLVTGANSKVVIKFADGSLTQVASNSILILDTLSLYSGGAMADTRLRLQQGQVETHANPKSVRGSRMQVITPTAIAAVRGTQFRVSAEHDSIKQETLTGLVDFEASEQVVAVGKGYGTVSEQGKPPLTPVPLLPAADTSRLPSFVETLPVIFEMPKLNGASGWLGQVFSDPQSKMMMAEQAVSGSQLSFSQLQDGDYYLTIRAKDVYGIAGYDTIHQFTVNTQPSAPALIYPNHQSIIRDAQPEFKWQPSVQANAYLLQIASDAKFEHVIFNQRVSQSSVQISQPLTSGEYFWRVAALSMDGKHEDKGPYTSVAAFSFAPLPPMPDISQLKVRQLNNRIFVDTIQPLEGMSYQVRLANPYNQQDNVWVASGLNGQFDFYLREYGAQQLYIQHVDKQGVAGPAAFYEFNASPL
jgi:hypothetical protein